MTTYRTTPEIADAPSDLWAIPVVETRVTIYRKPSFAEVAGGSLVELLAAAFERQPLLDGEAHPADDIIADFLESDASIAYPSALENIILHHQDSDLVASTLQCAAHFEPRWTDSRKAALVRSGLQSDDIVIKDAAVRAAECWICAEIIQVLENHQDQTPWLQEYIDEVIADADCLAAIRGAQS